MKNDLACLIDPAFRPPAATDDTNCWPRKEGYTRRATASPSASSYLSRPCAELMQGHHFLAEFGRFVGVPPRTNAAVCDATLATDGGLWYE